MKVRITGHKDAPRIEFLDLPTTLAALRMSIGDRLRPRPT